MLGMQLVQLRDLIIHDLIFKGLIIANLLWMEMVGIYTCIYMYLC